MAEVITMTGVPVHPEIPIPVERYVRTLANTADEVWTLLILREHKSEKKLLGDWNKVLESTKARSI